MTIYIIILLIEIFFGILLSLKKNKNSKRIFLVVSFIILATISGFRTVDVGMDTEQYYRAYQRINSYNSIIDAFNERYEKGFVVLCYTLGKISSDPQVLIFVTSIFINFCVLRFIDKNSKNVVYSVFLYITLNFYFSYMNIMRQAISICFLLLSYQNLREKKYFLYFVDVIFAILFHSSAILGLLFIIADKFEYKKKYNKFLIPLFIIIFIFGRNILMLLTKFSPRLLEYVGGDYDFSNYFGTLIIALMSFGILYFGNNILQNKKDKDIAEYNFLQKIIILNVIFAVLGIRVNILSRFVQYFSIFQIIWIPNIFSIMKKNKQEFQLLFSIIFILYWVIIMIYRPEWYGVVPYEMIKII